MIMRSRSATRFIWREVIMDDIYGLRQYPTGAFDTFIDIGANIGFFSITAKILNPKSDVFAIESSPETYDVLVKNADGLWITTIKGALGNGETLPNLTKGRMTDDTFLKLDCKGGELSILDDESSEAIIRRAKHIAIDFNFQTPERLSFPPIEVIVKWFYKFQNTHSIRLKKVIRKSGTGLAILRRHSIPVSSQTIDTQ